MINADRKFEVTLIDTAGIQNLLDFDFREYKNPDLNFEVRKYIKKVFIECTEDVRDLLPSIPLRVEVHLEQERRSNQFISLAYYDSSRSSESRITIGVYYDTITKIGKGVVKGNLSRVADRFKATVYHELIHAADRLHLSEIKNTRYRDLSGVNYNHSGRFFDANALPDEVNVQWALLDFFYKFRAEGIAILGQKLMTNGYREANLNSTDALQKFNDIIIKVIDICSGLKFYHRFRSHEALVELQGLGMFAYEIADVLFVKALGKEELIESLVYPVAENQTDQVSRNVIHKTIKEFINIDLSEFIQVLLSLPELNFREQFLQVCAVIQREEDTNAIKEFSRNLIWTGYNREAEKYIQIVKGIMGSTIPLEEIIEMHKRLSKESYTEDIMQEIQAMATDLLLVVQNSGSEVAHWALTYLFDDEDLIHDDISYLGWQDDWVVLDSAMRILNLRQ